MPEMDAIPILSQLKSLVQVIGGDAEGARKTQENFSRQMPVVSQMRSLVEVSMGDAEAALETQRQFGQGMSDLADAIPVVGHVKGGIHYAVGDTEGGDRAMKSSSRTVGVMGGGVVGLVVGGPVGAIAGGVAGGAAVDTVTTIVDSNVHGEYRPSGMVGSIEQLTEAPEDVGPCFDTDGTVALDGVTGLAAGAMIGGRKAPPSEKDKEVWYIVAHVIVNKMKDKKKHCGPSMPTTVKELKSFLEDIGYEFEREGKGSHSIYKFTKPKKFCRFLEEMGEDSVTFFGVAERLTVAGNVRYTLEGIVKQALGLARGKAAEHIKILWFRYINVRCL